MALLHVPLERITETNLEQLIAGQAKESRYIDYKAATYGNSDKDLVEYRADISSFANTAGGDVVIGMEEVDGKPIKFAPLAGSVDKEKLRLESMARSGLEPPLVGVGVREVSVSGGHIIVVRAPRSFIKPHRLIFAGRNRFWMRASAGKYEPSVQELRMLFGAGGEMVERVKMTLDDRLRIIRGNPPIPIPTSPLIIIHVFPLSALDPSQFLETKKLEALWQHFPPPGRTSPAEHTITFDGLLCLANFNVDKQVFHAYAAVNHLGVVEGVAALHTSEGYVEAAEIDKYTVLSVYQYMKTLADLGVEAPYSVHVSLVNSRELKFISGTGEGPTFAAIPPHRDPLSFSSVVLDERPLTVDACAQSLVTPLLQQLWNCAGFLSPRTLNGGKYLFRAG